MTLWGDRLTFEVSSADPDDTPVWVDLSAYLMAKFPLDLRIGRQNDLDQAEPSTVTFTLNNNDDRFTYGNTSSPYAAWWGPGRKCRLRESVNGQVLDRFTGYLQTPTEQVQVEGADQVVQVAAVDRLGRLASSPTFVSTLGAQIQYAGDSLLVGHYPLNDAATPWGSVSSTFPALTVGNTRNPSVVPTTDGPPLVAAGVDGPPGDDTQGLDFQPLTSASGQFHWNQFVKGTLSTTLTVSAGEKVAIALWVRSTDQTFGAGTLVDLRHPAAGGCIMQILDGAVTGARCTFDDFTSGGSATVSDVQLPTETWRLLAARVAVDTGLVELWNHQRTPVTGTLSLPSASFTFSQVIIGLAAVAGIAHVQVYVGADPYTRAMHLEQIEQGLLGLERQATGARVRTIAAYAGIPDTELDIDGGTTVMQVATLADRTPLAAMREAENTEQGLLYVDGSGVLHFKDRRSLYNI